MVPPRWSHAVWGPPGRWCRATHSSSRIQMRTWCTWSPAQTSASRTCAAACWARGAARATRRPRPSTAVSCCAVAAASTRHRWSWLSAAAANSTGAALSSAGSASGWWSCTHAGDCRPACAQQPPSGPGKADNLNSPHYPPQKILVIFFVLVWFLGPHVIYYRNQAGDPKGTNWGLPEAWAFVAATDQRDLSHASGCPHVAAADHSFVICICFSTCRLQVGNGSVTAICLLTPPSRVRGGPMAGGNWCHFDGRRAPHICTDPLAASTW